MAIGDGRDGRGHDHPRHARIAGESNRPQRAIARRYDQFVRVLDGVAGQGGRDVGDVAASGDRGRPAGIARKVRRKERKAVIIDLQPASHFGFALEVADGRMDFPSRIDQSANEKAGNITASTRH